MAERIDPADAEEAHERDALLGYFDWLDGGDLDVENLVRAADRMGASGSEARLKARGRVAIALARDRAERGGDWMEPPIGLREEAGRLAAQWFRQDPYSTRLVSSLVVGAVPPR